MSQQQLSALVDTEASRHLLEDTMEIREAARLRCVVRERAGDWLCALPSKPLGRHLRRSEFVAAGWWSYLAVTASQIQHHLVSTLLGFHNLKLKK